MFHVYFMNRVAYKVTLFIIKAILQEGSDNNIKRSDLINNDNGKETLLLLKMF
jgi:hypothetical protein